MTLKFTFKRYTDTTTVLIWAENLFIATDMVGAGWNLVSIEK